MVAIIPRLDTLHDDFAGQFANDFEPIVLSPFLRPPGLMIDDPVLMEHVFKTQFEKYEKGNVFKSNFHDLLANGIFNSDGEQWKTQRKLASNIFNVKNFRDFVEHAFAEKMQDLVAVLNDAADKGELVNLNDLFLRFTMDGFCKIAFGVEIGCLTAKERPAFAVSFDRCQITLQHRFVFPFHRLYERISPAGAQFRRDLAVIRDFSRSIIARRAQQGPDALAAISQHDLLGYLIKARDATATTTTPDDDDALATSLINFLFAGRDTTGLTLTWLFLLLSRHPSVLARLQAEIDDATAALEPSETVSYDTVRAAVPYATAVMRETLRLYPPVPFNTKQAVADDVLPGGIRVRKGMSLNWGPYALGRNKKVWGEDAREFRPERWLEMQHVPSAYAYNVFNAGPRVCLGKNFAEIEVVFVVVELLRRFRFGVKDEGKGGGRKTYTMSATLAIEGGELLSTVERR
ncbi:cytochrome P450 [Zopfochytrium polystomum]|nr:cytochrome P450 [Zopfochytrium polystomum]